MVRLDKKIYLHKIRVLDLIW